MLAKLGLFELIYSGKHDDKIALCAHSSENCETTKREVHAKNTRQVIFQHHYILLI
jgi:hypothetical protein